MSIQELSPLPPYNNLDNLTNEQIVAVVQAFLEAKKRKPLDFHRQTFYSSLDFWYYLAIEDPVTCWTCDVLKNQVFSGTELRLMFPWHLIISSDQIIPLVHPHCLLPNTICESDEIVAGVSSWYDGPVIRVSTKGHNITVTPNHMFLTTHGFAAAYLLRKDDEIVCDSCFQREPSVEMNNDRSPPRIDEIIKSLPMSLGMSPVSMPVAAEDLHGDAAFTNGYVNIVRTDRFLRDAMEPSLLKKLPQQNLASNNSLPGSFSRKSAFAEFLQSVAFAADGGMSSTRKPDAFFTRRLAHAQKHAFTSVPWFDASRFETQNHATSRDPEMLAHCLDRHASFIELDDVVSVHVKSFRGYVHDLQTASTLYSGNGYILSNCRCTLLRVSDINDYLSITSPPSAWFNFTQDLEALQICR